ncbi:MAG: hypothetical protein H0X21_03955 [Actinobacteria bacterium]|nr:hypothetical protein [Actinomycetota bacterium]
MVWTGVYRLNSPSIFSQGRPCCLASTQPALLFPAKVLGAVARAVRLGRVAPDGRMAA